MALTDRLINQETGEIDHIAVIAIANIRAAAEWGGKDFPPAFYRSALQWCEDRASSMRTAWRRDHGLSDDTICQPANIPSWGDSGDSFGAAR